MVFEVKDEYKHTVLKSRGYPVDPTTSKAIDDQVDALLDMGLVEEIPDNESPQLMSPAVGTHVRPPPPTICILHPQNLHDVPSRVRHPQNGPPWSSDPLYIITIPKNL